ncbi:hypothetical protein CAG70_14940 [Photobacterium halotolerans]|uniref:AfsA-related hotdog domain-containing protein n=1 Tax=Photobacterium halotolerans TaxID=265726 RepID=UPI001372D5D2|nr:AfsA-related hotdog domain-containing protein [Photobacterium halotolerans]NAX48282.1 hypothetical protein [Photobacterium halotolerans]
MELQGATICSKLNQVQHSVVEGSTSELNCSYRNTVSKELVHRAAVSEVFLTDVEMISEDKFITGAHLPKTHAYYNDIPSTNGKIFYDNILLLEICRQTSIIITHNHYQVPLTAKFIFNEAKFRILDNNLLLMKSTPSSVLTEVDVISKDMRNGKLSGLTFEMRLYINGHLSATKLMDISWLDAAVWKKSDGSH